MDHECACTLNVDIVSMEINVGIVTLKVHAHSWPTPIVDSSVPSAWLVVGGILIFFFPGGYTLILFFGMASSHSYMYGFDHARVLGTVPKCIYASIGVTW